jgi:hypothetical protein
VGDGKCKVPPAVERCGEYETTMGMFAWVIASLSFATGRIQEQNTGMEDEMEAETSLIPKGYPRRSMSV